ncbi:MAG: hypothetical protein JXA69_11850, partial [Phycisphaerae bacterium]|nr:hypothetical protein [Phycisphaerae bacterium]
RRGLMGAVLSRLITDDDGPAEDEYKFLPEHKHPAWREQIEEVGVVRGMAQRIRGVADDYVHEKLDEIERRIDQKLDEIDRRLAEWRDREIANRLRIIKITLVVSIVVAGLSLGYSALRARVVPNNERAAPKSAAPEEAPQ